MISVRGTLSLLFLKNILYFCKFVVPYHEYFIFYGNLLIFIII